MEYRPLGASGLRVSTISLGSWLTFGSKVTPEDTRKLVQRAFDLGINLFDSADVYANGRGEEALGYGVRELPRHQLVIATKAYFPMSEQPNDRGLSRKHLMESVEGSLKRLGTDYIDLHQCHRADPDTPLEETVRAYEDLIRQGKLLYWGVSEWPTAAIVDACRIADRRNAYRPISNQPGYSMLRRQIERDVLPVSEREGMSQIVYSPLAQGVLTGKYSDATPDDSRAADAKRNQTMNKLLEPSAIQAAAKLRPLAEELGVSCAQLALAWCLRHASVASVIIGITRMSQLEDNAGAAGVEIPPRALARIEELFPPGD